jgi:hypothetical protein
MKSLPLAAAAVGSTLVLFFVASTDALAAASRRDVTTRARTATQEPRLIPERRPRTNPPGRVEATADEPPGYAPVCDGVVEWPVTPPPQYRVSAASPFVANCDGVPATGTLYVNSEVEPHAAINPLDPDNLIAAWQQDRWGNGGARGIVNGVSHDAGKTWNVYPMPFTRCGGGNAGNGGNYARGTDPWLSFSPDGTAHQMALVFTGASLQPGSSNAMVVSRSLNGGAAWSNPIALISDGDQFFNDKNSITADPTDSNYVYAVWDRLGAAGGGPAYFARTTNGGVTWEPARSIYDPGPNSQTIGNLVAVRSDGLLLNLFTQLDEAPDTTTTGFLAVQRSTDKGATWSAPIYIAELLAIGASDPETGTAIRDGSILPEIAIAPNGTIYVVWQDARFSGGTHDGIALSRSTDGGLTWSAPVRVNRKASVPAFTPNVHVRADGTVAVTYYDLGSNTSDPTTLPTDYWIAQSGDGLAWQWSRISPAFDLSDAPIAGGYFVGDYQGLVGRHQQFIPVFVRTNVGTLSNRTDVFAAPTSPIPIAVPSAADLAESLAIVAATPPPASAALRRRVHENIVRHAEGLPSWRHGQRRRNVPPPRPSTPTSRR